ncbi:muscle LIM protein Mlp84B-like isoform X3 [Euwallacea similis]|uniref:muscle LIM protein Mlp84B-like isoform X3 n=1 Tax=Euwallacea similis TaxID=1736056 RepID=UPI003450CB74
MDPKGTVSVVVLAASAWTLAPNFKGRTMWSSTEQFSSRRPLPKLLMAKVVPSVAVSCMLLNRCLLGDVAGINSVSAAETANAGWIQRHIVTVPMVPCTATAFHKSCFKCGDCNKRLDSVNVTEGPDKDIYCKVCYGKKFGPKGYGYGQGGGTLQSDTLSVSGQAPKITVADTAAIKAPPGQGCPRCGGVVFAAEEVLAKGRQWHRKCFKCRDCTKTLDSIIACDGPDSDVYCKTCYGKKWGPHGYGFACGSGFLQTDGLSEEEISRGRPFYNPDTTSIKAPPGQGCPRCGGMVFAAEQQLAKGTMWHKKCFNCAECHRPLDSTLACDGPDREVHCRACYAKLFGPKGFGFGHTPTLVCTDGSAPVIHDPRPNSGPRGAPGQGCKRCGYAVFAAEQMISKTGMYHKRCFSCADCGRSLDSTNQNDAPNGEIYCRGCYGRNFGPRGVGFGMGAGTLTMA